MSTRLFRECEGVLERFEWPDVGEVALYSSRSPAKSTPSEDGALVAHLGDGRLVLAVADGVGGHAAGGAASRRALEALQASLDSAGADTPLREAVLAGIDAGNESVLGLGIGAATTIATVVISAGRARAYYVGDSQVVAFGGRGKVKLETIPHSPIGFGVEAGFVAEDEALGHADRHLISNVVGTPDMHIGISAPLALRRRDTVVVASDGLFDNVPVAAVIERLRRGPLLPALESLARECTERMVNGGHPDDLTALVFRGAPAPGG